MAREAYAFQEERERPRWSWRCVGEEEALFLVLFTTGGHKTGCNPSLLQCALKFEHKTSKGCSGGAPYEWTVYG
jgi:hypothetical protein